MPFTASGTDHAHRWRDLTTRLLALRHEGIVPLLKSGRAGPAEVRRRGVTVKKKSAGVLMIVNLTSPDKSRPDLYLSNYATIQLRDELARLDGIGDIVFLGQRASLYGLIQTRIE